MVLKKEKQVISIEQFHKRSFIIGKILSTLLPGAGHLWIDYPLKGSLINILFFFLLLKLIFWNGVITNPWLMVDDPSYTTIVIVCSLIVVLYTYSIWSFTKSSVKLSQFLSLIRVTRKECNIKK